MLSKHWDHPNVHPIILKLLITIGNITLIPKEDTEEKENNMIQKNENTKIKKKY